MPGRKLVRDLIWVSAVKLLALTAIYFLFFASPPHIDAARYLASPATAASDR
jgi:hypothetical protein